MQAAAALQHRHNASETPQDVLWMNVAAAVLLALAMLCLLAAGVVRLSRLPYFDVQRVQIEGDLVRNNLATVRANIVPRMQGGFFSLDLARSREVFESVPWVRQAQVRRVWPNELRVVLQEHQPVAYWHHEDREDQLVNSFGEVFDANLGDVEDERLPTLSAPANPNADDARLMLAMLHALRPVLAPLGEIETLKLTERGSWSVALDNDASIQLGRGERDEVLARAARFVSTLPQVYRAYPAPLVHADLRYASAYAVKLRGVTSLPGADATRPGAPKPAVVRPPAGSPANKPLTSTR